MNWRRVGITLLQVLGFLLLMAAGLGMVVAVESYLPGGTP